MSDPLVVVEGLQVEFTIGGRLVPVVADLDFEIRRGETLGIVGESGCGKSMTALAILGLIPSPPGRIGGGRILFNGENLLAASHERMRRIRGHEIAMVFQEPMTSLNPVFTIGDQISEVMRLHQGLSRRAAMERAEDMLRSVHIPSPDKRLRQYPHELSGGMRQRVMIAIALACNPKVLIADEPTTALDVTVQAQIFDLLKELQETTGTAIILITHNMGAVAEICERVFVMYAGRKVEEGPVGTVLGHPSHPYTQGLIKCTPHINYNPTSVRPRLSEIPGTVPPLTELGIGCPFAPRCGHAMQQCELEMPAATDLDGEHRASCWLLNEGRIA